MSQKAETNILSNILSKVKLFSGSITYQKDLNILRTYPVRIDFFDDKNNYLHSVKLSTNNLIKLIYYLENINIGDNLKNILKGQEYILIQDKKFNLKIKSVVIQNNKINKLIFTLEDKQSNKVYTFARTYNLFLKMLYTHLNKYFFKLKYIPAQLFEYAVIRLNNQDIISDKTKAAYLHNFLARKILSIIDVVYQPKSDQEDIKVYIYMNNFNTKNNTNKFQILYSIKQGKKVLHKSIFLDIDLLYSLIPALAKQKHNKLMLNNIRKNLTNLLYAVIEDQMSKMAITLKKYGISGTNISYLKSIGRLFGKSILFGSPDIHSKFINQLLYTLVSNKNHKIDIVDKLLEEYITSADTSINKSIKESFSRAQEVQKIQEAQKTQKPQSQTQSKTSKTSKTVDNKPHKTEKIEKTKTEKLRTRQDKPKQEVISDFIKTDVNTSLIENTDTKPVAEKDSSKQQTVDVTALEDPFAISSLGTDNNIDNNISSITQEAETVPEADIQVQPLSIDAFLNEIEENETQEAVTENEIEVKETTKEDELKANETETVNETQDETTENEIELISFAELESDDIENSLNNLTEVNAEADLDEYITEAIDVMFASDENPVESKKDKNSNSIIDELAVTDESEVTPDLLSTI